VDRTFVATAPNELWVADVTYVSTVQGWLYLACVTDVFSRMVLGWSMASHRKTELVVDAVSMAVQRRGGHVPGVIHHSIRGSELSSRSPRNTGLARSLFATLECELFNQQPSGRFQTRREAPQGAERARTGVGW
jgi:Integrase core domain.